MTVGRKHYRIKSRVRFIIFIVTVLLLLSAAINFAFGVYHAEASEKEQYRIVCVADGDTLWKIASDYMPQDRDIRESVYLICTINNTSAQELHPGQKLKIPVNI